MSLYGVDVDPTQMNTSHAQVVDLVGPSRRVLDVGCWRGDTGRVLMERGCTVSGFEVDPEAAAQAAEVLDDVRIGDLNAVALSEVFRGELFDVVIFADVLEHVLDPEGVLADACSLLAADGRVVISIPNVGHGSLRLAHLQGRWDMTDTGLLDRTHIKFFTRQSLVALVTNCGFEIVDFRGTTADPLAVEVDVDRRRLPPGALWWVRAKPESYIYQFQLAAVPSPTPKPPTPLRLPTTQRQNLIRAVRGDAVRFARRFVRSR